MKITRRNALKSLAISAASISLPLQSRAEETAFDVLAEKITAFDVLLKNQKLSYPALIPHLREIFEHTNLTQFVGVQPIDLSSNLYGHLETYHLKSLTDNRELKLETDSCNIDKSLCLQRNDSIYSIDREVLTNLRNNAGTIGVWDFNIAGDTIKEKYESLYVKVIEISNVVHRKTLRGGCNWIVTSPEVASVFEAATAGFAPSETFTSSLGIQYVGTINNRWRLYRDSLFPQGQILLGYKGESDLDSGYIFCPSHLEPTDTGIVLRYGSSYWSPDHYAAIELEKDA